MAQEQKYSVVNKFAGFELRNYDACLVADVKIDSDFEKAGNAGFGPLVSFIGGRNETGAKIAMTAPVIQEPVDSAHVISFVLPVGVDLATAPKPTDNRVSLRPVPNELVAVDQFSGRWTQSLYQDRVSRLQLAIKEAGFSPAGNARFARFDPPWTPWFMRRNEIQIPVAPLP